jgi:hypothetical protein
LLKKRLPFNQTAPQSFYLIGTNPPSVVLQLPDVHSCAIPNAILSDATSPFTVYDCFKLSLVTISSAQKKKKKSVTNL